MPKFRKKPVVIEAVRVSDIVNAAAPDDLPVWVEMARQANKLSSGTLRVRVTTPEGVMVGEADDWIIRGVKGELYPCKPDIFEATYEQVEE